jgi:hypothetical protein
MNSIPLIDQKIVKLWGSNHPLSVHAAAMGINWMNADELAEAIPPVYSEFLFQTFL